MGRARRGVARFPQVFLSFFSSLGFAPMHTPPRVHRSLKDSHTSGVSDNERPPFLAFLGRSKCR